MEYPLIVATQVTYDIAHDLSEGVILPPGSRWVLIGFALILLLGMLRFPMFLTELWTQRKFKKQLQEARRSK